MHSLGMQKRNRGCHENVTLCRSGDFISSDGAISQSFVFIRLVVYAYKGVSRVGLGTVHI